MRYLLVLLLLAALPARAIVVNGPCSTPQTVGGLTVNATSPRISGISPLLVFFDNSNVTSSAVVAPMNAFQDVYSTWDFGDTLSSGTTTWAYGSAAGHNLKRYATGNIAAHLYVTQGSDRKFTATVASSDGVNQVACGIGVTVFDPSGANGFPTTNTTCVASSTLPVAGSGGCPAGAGVLQQSSFATAVSTKIGAGKRVLFKCGDTFTTGSDTGISVVKWSLGAYGGCENTQSLRPIINTAGTSLAAILVTSPGGDGRISDLDFEGGGTGIGAVNQGGNALKIPYQITMYNLKCAGNRDCYTWLQGAQYGVIGSTQVAARGIGTYVNENENNPPYSGNTFNNLDYQAVMGNNLSGPGTGGGGGIEVVRVSAGRLMVYENNTLMNSNTNGADLKLHNGDTYGSCDSTAIPANNQQRCVNSGNASGNYYPCVISAFFATTTCWTGNFTELAHISDNYLGGNGGLFLETAPQNSTSDERLRNIVVERNILDATQTVSQGGFAFESQATNQTVRDNVFYLSQSGTSTYSGIGFGVGQRATNGINSAANEVYNNTCYTTSSKGQDCITLAAIGDLIAGAGTSIVKNNLFYASAGANATVVNTGSGNTVSNNTSTVTTNPAFTNGSGAFNLLTDYKPTANFSGGVSVPNFYDALGVAWSPTWDLGAIHH